MFRSYNSIGLLNEIYPKTTPIDTIALVETERHENNLAESNLVLFETHNQLISGIETLLARFFFLLNSKRSRYLKLSKLKNFYQEAMHKNFEYIKDLSTNNTINCRTVCYNIINYKVD